jgi:hypothetical protein
MASKIKKVRGIAKINKAGTLRAVRGIHFKKRNLEVVERIVSQRNRPHAMAAPQAGQPLSAQDYWMTSTAIKSAAYDDRRAILQINFVKGGSYLYYNVPEWVWLALNSAASKGRYFYYNIRTSYTYSRVR